MKFRRDRTYKLFPKTKTKVLNITTSFIMVVSSLSGALPLVLVHDAFAAPTTVTQNSTNGWQAVDDNGHGGTLSYVSGPGTTPAGNGSAQLEVDNASQGYMLFKSAYGGTKLSDISNLSYSTYVQTGNNLIAPSLQIDVTSDVNAPTSWQGRLVYEPYMNSTVTDGTWQSWNAATGKWWLSKPSAFGNNCDQNNPCTFQQLETLYPNIGVNTGILQGVGFKAGSSWNSFVGNVDNFTFNNDTYDFEVSPSLTSGDFATWDNSPSFKGIDVGFFASDFGTVSNVTVDVARADGSHVVKTADSGILNLLSGKTTPTAASAPIIIQPGTYNESDGYWNPQTYTGLTTTTNWNTSTLPTSVIVTVTGTNGTQSVTMTPLTQTSGAEYNSLVPPDTTNFAFVGSPKYVRANNAGDESARILVSNQAGDARFFVDGSSVPVSGSYVGPSTSTTAWWRLKTALNAGEHTITAQVKIGANWYDVNGSGTAYSIDTPWATYVLPQANAYYRPNDKVVRVKADDEFNQFDHMITTVNGVAHTVNRSDCSDQGSYVFCDLQNLNLPQGTYTATTTTYTKANNRADNVVSQPFTIDATAPVVLNARINGTAAVYSKSATFVQYVQEANSLNGLSFYLTHQRADGQCDPNEATVLGPIQAKLGNHNGDKWYFLTTVDTSSLNGTYCVFSVAEDAAMNHSNPQQAKFTATFDNIVPTATITYSPSTPTNGNVTATLVASEPIQTPSGWLKKSNTTFQKSYPKNNKTPNYNQTVALTDLADNTGSAQVYIDWIDIIPPTVSDNNLDVSMFTGETTTLAPTVTGESGPVTYKWTPSDDKLLTNQNESKTGPTLEIGNAPKGSYTVGLTATDQAGNATSVTYNVTIADHANPSVIHVASLSAGLGGGNANPQNTGSSTTGDTSTVPADGTDSGEVLGSSTTSTTTTGSQGQVKGDSTVNLNNAANNKKNGKFLFLGWWWLAILAALGIGWFILAQYRRSDQD